MNNCNIFSTKLSEAPRAKELLLLSRDGAGVFLNPRATTQRGRLDARARGPVAAGDYRKAVVMIWSPLDS